MSMITHTNAMFCAIFLGIFALTNWQTVAILAPIIYMSFGGLMMAFNPAVSCKWAFASTSSLVVRAEMLGDLFSVYFAVAMGLTLWAIAWMVIFPARRRAFFAQLTE